MRHIIPTGFNEIYKGWNISIGKSSQWNKKLRVTITPAIQVSQQVVQQQSRENLLKAMLDLNAITDKNKHTFIVDPIYFMILPIGEAVKQARSYVDDKLGRFDINNLKK